MTEAFVAERFADLITGRKWTRSLPRYSALFEEVDCRQGRPDFVALEKLPTKRLFALGEDEIRILRMAAAASVLSVIHPATATTVDRIIASSGCRPEIARRILQSLDGAKLIMPKGRESFVLSGALSGSMLELTAFEVKVSDWRRALYQALQSKSFAHRTFTVFPSNRRHVLLANLEAFDRFGVGVITVDSDASTGQVLIPSRRSTPASRVHYWYALGQLLWLTWQKNRAA